MNEEFRQIVIDTLRRGEELPPEWARELFPPDKREYELIYYGKEREEDILADTMAVPLQPVRTFGNNGDDWHNMLIFGDNLQSMKTLLEWKKAGRLCNADGIPGIRLVYIDPPFATKKEFRGTREQKAYQDKIVGAEFIEFLRKRLVLLRELLADDGGIYVHLDYRKGDYFRVILDEIFGEANYINQLIWKRQSAHSDNRQGAQHYGRLHDIIYFYSKTSNYKFNYVYVPYTSEYVKKTYKYTEENTGRKYALGDLTAPGGANKGNPYYELLGVTRFWRYSESRMKELLKAGRIVQNKEGNVPLLKRYFDETGKGISLQSIWDDINPVGASAKERLHYPTQKPEALLDRIIKTSSNEGDIIMDVFAGSGTTLAVAEKLNRRWVGIDCGKLAIYTMQKRMLNLKDAIGNKGKALKPKPFTLYNAGLYDFSTLKQLPWADWRFFALQLFGCRDEPHTIGGLKLDGKLKGASVLVFNHLEHPGQRIDEDTVQDIHMAVGKRIGGKFFIIAPRGIFDFQQDYIDFDGVRYYALRIPYSIINELHHRQFTALQQPSDETSVNETVDAVGFDFIQPPQVEWSVTVKKRQGQELNEACLKIRRFETRARLRGKDTQGGLETFSMLMIDYDYNGEVFDFDNVFYAHQLQDHDWEAWFPVENLGEKIMAVFIDIYGNEAQVVIPHEQFTPRSSRPATAKNKRKVRK